MDWTHLSQEKDFWHTFFKMVINIRVPQIAVILWRAEKFLTSQAGI
jgi:hypothetical protein